MFNAGCGPGWRSGAMEELHGGFINLQIHVILRESKESCALRQ